MTALLKRARRRLGMTKQWLFPPPEAAAWRRAWHQAETVPRFAPGTIRMLDYELRYADLMSFCPMWHDIFVKRVLDVRCETDAPRVLDCGANVGLASLYFRRAYPKARITAYEADPAIHAMLAANLQSNGASVEVVHSAIWTSNGTLVFHSEGSDSGMIGELPGAVAGRSVTVPSARLRDLLEREPCDVLKLDIEGAEDAVLTDCEPVLHRVRALIMDLHEFDPRERQVPRVLERLTRAGFDYAIDEFVPLPWREPLTGPKTPFPGRATQWAMTVRAWQRA